MKNLTFATIASTALAAAAIALASPSLADGANPLVPEGTNPSISTNLGFHNPNTSNDSGTTNPAGGVDLAS
jgi:hypothetical protein